MKQRASEQISPVDRTGTIRWQHVDPDDKTRPTPAQMLNVADRTLAK